MVVANLLAMRVARATAKTPLAAAKTPLAAAKTPPLLLTGGLGHACWSRPGSLPSFARPLSLVHSFVHCFYDPSRARRTTWTRRRCCRSRRSQLGGSSLAGRATWSSRTCATCAALAALFAACLEAPTLHISVPQPPKGIPKSFRRHSRPAGTVARARRRRADPASTSRKTFALGKASQLVEEAACTDWLVSQVHCHHSNAGRHGANFPARPSSIGHQQGDLHGSVWCLASRRRRACRLQAPVASTEDADLSRGGGRLLGRWCPRPSSLACLPGLGYFSSIAILAVI